MTAIKRVVATAALALVTLVAVHAQTSAWKVSFTLPQSQYVLGEPIVGTIDFHNASSSCVPTPQLYGDFYLDQDPAPCRAWDAPPVEGVPPTPPPGASYGPPSSPKMEQPGATKSFPVNISLLCFERQARNPIGKHRLCLRDTEPNGLGELCVSFSVVAPTGMDAQAYQAFKGHPLKHPAELLKRFPTSTYAGYELRARIPALAREALTDLNNPDGTLRRWSDRGGSEANIQGHITKVQKSMRSYAEAAGAFLRAHPDFAYAPEIRRGYAMCLGLTGHMPEAMAELQTLKEGTGREAEEAKAYLGEAPKKKSQKETPHTP